MTILLFELESIRRGPIDARIIAICIFCYYLFELISPPAATSAQPTTTKQSTGLFGQEAEHIWLDDKLIVCLVSTLVVRFLLKERERERGKQVSVWAVRTRIGSFEHIC